MPSYIAGQEVAADQFRAQHGEDRILAREFAGRRDGYFVEVGAYNGESYSNTFYLEKSLGWSGVLVEADPALATKCTEIRPGGRTVNCAAVAPGSPDQVTFEVVEGCQWVSSLSVSKSMLKRIEDIPVTIRRVTVPARTLDAILEECGAPRGIDFISIDVEGHEHAVLQGFTPGRWDPKVVMLERNHHLPDARIMRYMHANGFRWRRTTGPNDWFYSEAASAPARYRFRLFLRYYLPKYLTLWMPVMNGPVKRAVKWTLRKVGALEMLRRRRSAHRRATH
ncbi:MAG: FkbM family methyltransferase [Phycisphaerales bacterium]|nr:FkbM family methyltransferase [Phycisphaerales bacterium]MDB5354222.1 FkbM family methyltransferase [Phycisphaerales bacterium]